VGAKAAPFVSTSVSWHNSVTGRPAQQHSTANSISSQTVGKAIDHLAQRHILQSHVQQGFQHSCDQLTHRVAHDEPFTSRKPQPSTTDWIPLRKGNKTDCTGQDCPLIFSTSAAHSPQQEWPTTIAGHRRTDALGRRTQQQCARSRLGFSGRNYRAAGANDHFATTVKRPSRAIRRFSNLEVLYLDLLGLLQISLLRLHHILLDHLEVAVGHPRSLNGQNPL